jgi:uncharacterized membrane protein YfcA
LITDPWFWLVSIVAVILTGISKGGLGGGVGGFGVPIMALAIAPPQAAAIMLPVLCIMDLTGFQAYWGKWDKHVMKVIVPAGLAGIFAGTLTFTQLNNDWIRVLLGVISLGFLAYNLAKRDGVERPKLSDAHGWFWASISGFTSFVAHAGGPPLSVYLLVQRLDKTAFVATSLIFFGSMNYAKLLPYWWLDLFDTRNLLTSLVLIPLGVAGTWLGVWLHKRIDPTSFFRIIYAAFFLTGTKLLWDGISGLI